ncbi:MULTISPECIES: MFS transporter [Streptomyces]
MSYLRLLRRRHVFALWTGQALSVLGDRLYAMALMWMAWQEWGAAAMGLVAVAESIPYIVMGVVGRRFVARFNALRTLAYVDLVRAGLLVLMPLAWAHTGIVGTLVLALLVGAGGAVFEPNLGALVPELVDEKDVQAVNGLMDLSGRVARIAGPGAAGILLTIMPMPTLFLIDAATFAASAVALLLLGQATAKPREQKADPGIKPRVRVLLRTHPATGVAMAVHGLGIAAHTASFALPAFIALHMGGGAGAYGAVLAVTGAGSVLANTVAGNRKLPANRPVFYCLTWAVSGVLLASVALAASLPALLVVSLLIGATHPFLQISLSTHLSSFPPAHRLRLMSADLTWIRTLGTASLLCVPAVAASRPALAFAVAGVSLAAVAGMAAVAAARLTPTATELGAGQPVMAREQ